MVHVCSCVVHHHECSLVPHLRTHPIYAAISGRLNSPAYFGADWIFCLGLTHPGDAQCTSLGAAVVTVLCRECTIGTTACRDNMAYAGSLQLF